MKSLAIQQLTAESFAPYGRVIEHLDHPCTKSGPGWGCFSPVDFMLPDAPLGVGIVHCERVPEELEALERHVSREELLWTTTENLVMAVDLPIHLGDEYARPNADTTKVFLLKAGQAVILNRGTWHSPAFTLEGESTYFFLVEWKKDLIDQDAQPWIPFQNEERISVE